MDLLLHFAISILIMVSMYSVTFKLFKRLDLALWAGLITTTMAGMVKEIYDLSTDGLFSLMDILADFIGLLVGMYICYKILLKKKGWYI